MWMYYHENGYWLWIWWVLYYNWKQLAGDGEDIMNLYEKQDYYQTFTVGVTAELRKAIP